MEILLILLSSVIYQFIFYKLIKNFKVKNIFYILSNIIAFSIFYLFFEISIIFLPLLLIIQTLTTLSFIDYFHYEIDGNSYYFLIIPSIFLMLLSNNIVSGIISFLLIFFVLFVIEKVSEKYFNYKLKKSDDTYEVEETYYEGIGGADIKILLILSVCFDLVDSFSFIFNSTLFTTILYILLCIKNKKFSSIKIPMIISITIGFIYTYYFYLNYFL